MSFEAAGVALSSLQHGTQSSKQSWQDLILSS